MTPVFGMEYFILEQGHRVNRPNWNIYGILMYIIYIYIFSMNYKYHVVGELNS